jgi:glycosyltransferase involved in cell wall biosynthesis
MVVHGPFPPDPRVARAVAVAVDRGWEVDVLATRQPAQEATELVRGARVIRLPIAHHWGSGVSQVAREYLGFTLLASVRAARLMVRRRYDVIHVNNPPDFLFLSALVPKLLGAKVIFDVHDLAPDMFAMRFGRRRGADVADRALRLVERAATGFADAVLTVHEPYRRELEARGVSRDKLTVVMNTVDERLLPADGDRSAGDGFRVVYHGTVTPHYGVDLLVAAFATVAGRVSDARLEIYGDGDAVPGVRRLAAELGIADRVSLSDGFLSQEDVVSHVRSASVGVIPNLPTPLNRFALSTKLFEYVALGVPVVAADLPTIREHFTDSELRYFRAGDPDSAAAALLSVHADPPAAAARAQAALERYEHYGWATNAERYAELLDRCARRRSR